MKNKFIHAGQTGMLIPTRTNDIGIYIEYVNKYPRVRQEVN